MWRENIAFRMKIVVTIILSFSFCSAHDFFLSNANAVIVPSVGKPWPLPQQYKVDTTYMNIQPQTFQFILESLPKCDILLEAIQRYKSYIFMDDCTTSRKLLKLFQHRQKNNFKYFAFGKTVPNELHNLTIKISGECEKYPYMHMDEQYRLKINDPDLPGQAVLFSTSVWGALRGLETFSQLVYQTQTGSFQVNTTSILDFPRFPFRGVLLDTSRHFIPVSIILKNLDAMAQSKFNVFHWHIVDDPSFPYVSKQFPKMSDMGAFDPVTHIYSQKDVSDVIEYARVRGIRVLVEFDSPGHTLSWGKSQQELLTACYNETGPIAGKFGPIDPTNNQSYTFLRDFFAEIAQVFPDGYIHLGGDEVDFSCWKSNPYIQSFMKAHGFGTDYSRLEEYYMNQLVSIVKSLQKSYIVWQEVFDNGVKIKPDTVVHVWKDGYQSELHNVTLAGYKTILSSCWYLNYIKFGDNWHEYYSCDPHDFNGTSAQKDLVVGGEACIWGEFVDGSNLMTTAWPRAAVVAERLWSNQSVNDTTQATPRFEEFRCSMIKRGLKVEPANGPGFCQCDYLP